MGDIIALLWGIVSVLLEFLTTLYLLYIFLLFVWSTLSYFLPFGSFAVSLIITVAVAIYLGYRWMLGFFGETEED
jgi:hypothetical protein